MMREATTFVKRPLERPFPGYEGTMLTDGRLSDTL